MRDWINTWMTATIQVTNSKEVNPVYAKLISPGDVLPRSIDCSYGHLPAGYMPCYDGYVPYFGLCAFGKD